MYISDAVDTAVRTGGFLVGSSPPSTTSSPSTNVRLYGIDKWENILSTQMKLEFYQKRRRQWPMPSENLSWEVWDLNLEIVRTNSAGKIIFLMFKYFFQKTFHGCANMWVNNSVKRFYPFAS